MKKFFVFSILLILVFGISIVTSYYYSRSLRESYFASRDTEILDNSISFPTNITNVNIISNETIGEDTNTIVMNMIELPTIEAVSEEIKVTPNTEFAIKEYYDECGHFNFYYAKLPKELVNMTKQEIEDYYNGKYEVESLENNSLTLSKEINGLCDNHFFIKMGKKNVEVYRLTNDGELKLYKGTDISKQYLPKEDIEKLEEGIYVFGEGKIDSVLEDYE